MADGKPYLEPHHIRRLADEGPDHPAWVAALCPNCHRRIHHGADGTEFNEEVAQSIRAIEENSSVH
jgi:5-methylcytosine-specific restriction protein A